MDEEFDLKRRIDAMLSKLHICPKCNSPIPLVLDCDESWQCTQCGYSSKYDKCDVK